MRLVYMGTPDIARVCLQRLHERGFEIAAVYTKPDTPKNRGMKLAQSPVKEYALSVGLPSCSRRASATTMSWKSFARWRLT